jgi:hypothetical protein
MKTALLIILTCLLVSPPIVGQEKPAVMATASFGRHSDCSTGRGVCALSPSINDSEKIDGPQLRKISSESFILEIPNSGLSEKDQDNIAGKRFLGFDGSATADFVQEEKIVVDGKILEALGLDPKLTTLRAGSYPLRIGKDTTEITLTLSAD